MRIDFGAERIDMMRRLCCIAVAIVFLLHFVGCAHKQESADMPYEIVEENGVYYMVMNEPVSEPAASDGGFFDGGVGSVCFDSVEEMKRDLDTGNFTDEEWHEILRFGTDNAGRIPICDLSKLCVPVTPSNVEYGLDWSGTGFLFPLRSEEGLQGDFCFRSQTVFEDWVAEKEHFGENELIAFSLQTKDAERNADVYVYDTGVGKEQKAMYYVLSAGDKVLHIWEVYDDVAQPESVPTDIEIYGAENGQYYRVSLYGFQKRPSVQWLLGFGMTDYGEDPSWLIPVCVCGAVAVAGVGVGILFLWRKKRKSGASAAPVSAEEEEQ